MLNVAFNSSHAASQENNNAPVAAACRLIACILHNPKLTTLHLDHSPSACVAHAAWQCEGLPLPPSDVVAEGWTPVLEFLRVRCVCARSRSLPRARRVLRSRAPLQLPSRPLQAHRALFRENVSCALGAASALLVLGRCSVPARVLQHHALLGAMLSQRSLARVSLQRRQFLGSERLQLLCCGSPLSVLLLRLASAVDRGACSRAEHSCIVQTVKRYFSGVAHRLWQQPLDDVSAAPAPPKASADSASVPATSTAAVPVQAKAAVKAGPTLEDFIAAGCVMSCPCRCKYCSP